MIVSEADTGGLLHHDGKAGKRPQLCLESVMLRSLQNRPFESFPLFLRQPRGEARLAFGLQPRAPILFPSPMPIQGGGSGRPEPSRHLGLCYAFAKEPACR